MAFVPPIEVAEALMVPQIIFPDESVVSALDPEQVPKRPSVVEPMFETENKVEVAAPLLDEAMLKRIVGLVVMPVVVETKMERPAYGVEVPIPTLPPAWAKRLVEATLIVVKKAVLEAW